MAEGAGDSEQTLALTSPNRGHRQRLRARARLSAFKGMPDYELLELLLFGSIARKDTKPLAKALHARFGSLGGILAASEQELRSVTVRDSQGSLLDVGDIGALDIMAMQELCLRVRAEDIKGRTVIASWSALLAYVRQALGHEPREQFRVLFLDTKNQLIADEVMNRGTVDHAPVYPREVVRRALELSAKAVILVHNHPSGDPSPSKADIDMTRQVIEAGRALGVTVHDHLIAGRHGVESLKARGLI
jgi:DNA repair protein RadC